MHYRFIPRRTVYKTYINVILGYAVHIILPFFAAGDGQAQVPGFLSLKCMDEFYFDAPSCLIETTTSVQSTQQRKTFFIFNFIW